MTSQLVKTPATSGPVLHAGRPFQHRRPHTCLNARRLCTCESATSRREITTAEKALGGAAAAFLSLSLFTCQPASADLNKFEAAAGGEFGVGTAAQFGEAELRGKDFSGQVQMLTNPWQRKWSWQEVYVQKDSLLNLFTALVPLLPHMCFHTSA